MKEFSAKTILLSLVLTLIAWIPVCLCADRDPFLTPWEREEKQTTHREEQRMEWKQQSLPRDEKSYNKDKGDEFDDEGEQYVPSSKEEESAIRPDLDLKGVIWGEDGTGMVVIGDKIFHTGDVIMDGCVIGGIVDGTLIVKCEDKIWKYRVKDGGV